MVALLGFALRLSDSQRLDLATIWSAVVEDFVDRLIPRAERAYWENGRVAVSVKEAATRVKVRAFGSLVPTATQDAAGPLLPTIIRSRRGAQLGNFELSQSMSPLHEGERTGWAEARSALNADTPFHS